MILWITAGIVVTLVAVILLWPKSETLTYKHSAPKDIKQWVPRHQAPQTSEFSVIPHGENRHYVDHTAEHPGFGLRTDTTMMPAIKLPEVRKR